MNTLKNRTFPFKKLGDLIYHEGPILSLHIDENSNMFLYRWVDCDEEFNYWLLTSISSSELSQFYHKKLSLRQYYESSNERVIVKINNLLEIKDIYPLDILPEDYLPNKNSFNNETLYTEFSNSWKSMYLHGLGIVANNKANLYEYLGLKADTDNDIKVAIDAKDIATVKIPKISDLKEATSLLRALNHEVRRKILEFVFNTPGVSIEDIHNHFAIEDSIASAHLAILKKSNIITSKKLSNRVRYYINLKKIININAAIGTLEDKKEIFHL